MSSLHDPRTWLDAHQTLWRLEGFLSLAHFHACIDAADTKIEERTSDVLPNGLWESVRLTSFGHEVGGDVPRWWVFSGEPNVRELLTDTQRTFPAAQTLVRSAERLCREPAPTYEDIVRELGKFLQRHRPEIETFLTFAERLSTRHELAPAILFSYAVWGSTRRGDRSLEGTSEEDEVDRLRLAGELALGLRRKGMPTLSCEWLDLLDEDTPISPTRLLHGVQLRIRESIITYFTELRDSLRHIDTLCQEYFQRENLFADDRFVIRLLKKMADPAVVESDVLDIKERLEILSAPPDREEASSIKLAEYVAAFANCRGGVLLIGVADRTRELIDVPDAENQIKRVESIVRKYTDAHVDFVRSRAVPHTVAGATRTCLVVVVGETAEPVGVRQKDRAYSYPLRVGPGIERISRKEISARKAHKKGVSFAFAAELNEWTADVA